MRFRLRLAIDDEDVGNVNIECRATEKKVLFHMQDRALVLLEAHIMAFVRPPPSAATTRDPSQFHVTQANVLSLTLQTAFPAIPWLVDDRATGGPRLLRKRPRRESTGVSFYGPSRSSASSSSPMVSASIDAAFHYRILHSIECQVDGTAPVHHVFALQQPAIEFLRQIQTRRPAHNIKLFSFETRGSRKFLVSDIDVFYDKYMQTPPTQRHVYEIIQEDVPCHLYFDLEFKPALNPLVDGDRLVRQLKHLVALQFYRKFGVVVSAEDDIVDLVSTAPDKFSRHLVVIAPDGSLFVNNLEAGQFVKDLMDDFALDVDGDLSFLVKDKHGQPQSFVDTGVYTRNRAFRCVWSSKFQSDRILTRHPDCRLHMDNDKAFFLDTLICPVRALSGRRLLRCPRPSGRPGSTRSHRHHAQSIVGTNSSPMPDIDAFVLALATAQDDVQAGIRSWQVMPPRSITYHLVNNRFCHNVKRAHKSNNVMYVVDAVLGHVVQRCHDPTCASFASPPWPLPPEIRASLAEGLASAAVAK